MWLNVLHAVRRLKRRPLVASLIIANLALGLGCAVACTTVLNAVLFRALPFKKSDRLVLIWEDNSRKRVGLTPTSFANYQDLKAAASSFDALGAFTDIPLSLDGPQSSERLLGYRVTASVLQQTGVRAFAGRLFTSAEDQPGGPDVVVLSHGLWQRSFGAADDVVGRVIRLTGVPHTVVGIMPEGFSFPPTFAARLVGADVTIREADLWIPLRADPVSDRRELRSLFMLGRLRDGQSVKTAQAEVSAIARRLAADYPRINSEMDFAVVLLTRQVMDKVRTLLTILSLIGVLVLVISAINAVHILLADALAMTAETRLRLALGATRWHLAMHLGTANGILCGCAAACALLIASVIAVPIAAYTRANVATLNAVRIDATVWVATIGFSILVMVAISVLPLLHTSRLTVYRGAHMRPGSFKMSFWRRLFTATLLAIPIVVLSTAGLLVRSAYRLAAVNPGLSADGVSVFEVMLPETKYGAPARRVEFQRQMLDLLEDGYAKRAAFVDNVPFGDSSFVFGFTLENRTPVDERVRPRAAVRSVSSAYFNVFSIPLLEGRLFVATEDTARRNVAVVNDAFIRTYFPGEHIVGHRLKRGQSWSAAPWMTVVGVVGSVRSAGLAFDPEPEVFVPYTQSATNSILSLIVKTSSPDWVLVPAIAQRLHSVDFALSPTTVTTERELVSQGLGRPLFYARLFGVLAAAAFALGLIGVYGVAVLSISARSHELLLRICLGAQRGDILRVVFGDASIAIVAAAITGGLGAIAMQQWMAGVVLGVESIDWAVTASAVAVMSAFALGAVYLAARRVMDLVPADALKTAPRS
jgi:predicted permease